MKKLFSILVLLLAFSCKTAQLNTEPIIQEEENIKPAPPVYHETYVLYEVGSLDTLASVARKYNISPSQLIQANHINPPYTLTAGSVIKIPTSTLVDSNQANNPDEGKMPTVHIKPKTNPQP